MKARWNKYKSKLMTAEQEERTNGYNDDMQKTRIMTQERGI